MNEDTAAAASWRAYEAETREASARVSPDLREHAAYLAGFKAGSISAVVGVVSRVEEVGKAVQLDVLGGPLDGARAWADDPGVAPLVLRSVEGGQPVTDEPYVARVAQLRSGAFGWVALHASMVGDRCTRCGGSGLIDGEVCGECFGHGTSGPRDRGERPEPTFRAAQDEDVLMLPLCQPGQHEWGAWEPTPRGNSVRRCARCPLTQASIL